MGAVCGEGVTATHISRQGTGWCTFGFDGSHNDLTNLVIPSVVPALASAGHLAAVQHVNLCHPLPTQGAGACESLSACHHRGGRSM